VDCIHCFCVVSVTCNILPCSLVCRSQSSIHFGGCPETVRHRVLRCSTVSLFGVHRQSGYPTDLGERLEVVTEDRESKHGTGMKRVSDDLVHDLSSPMLSPGSDLVSPHSNVLLSPSTGQSQRPLMSPGTVAAVSPSEDHKDDHKSSLSKDSVAGKLVDDDSCGGLGDV
jgi:hypothetical protein